MASRVSLVIPAFNEEERLAPFLESVVQHAVRYPQGIGEIILVDDGSADATVQVAESFATRLPHLRVIKHERNKGKGAAVRTGVLSARSDLIVFMDADGATPITELPTMVDHLRTHDIAVGNRWMPGAQTARHSALRRLSGWVYRTYMQLFHLGDVDTMCGFKGYKAPVAKQLFAQLLESRWLFDTEVAYRAHLRGYTVKNFPISWESKDGSKLTTGTLLKTAFQILPLVRAVQRQERRAVGRP